MNRRELLKATGAGFAATSVAHALGPAGSLLAAEPGNAGYDLVAIKGATPDKLFDAGAKKVHVFDYRVDDWRRSYKQSGIEAAAKDVGAVLAPGDGERYFQSVGIGGEKLKQVKEHELILESDVFVNVPVLKHHGSANLTISMKT